MKKLIAMLLAGIMIFSVTACGSTQTANVNENTSDVSDGTQDNTDIQTTAADGKSIVIYFSGSGNTKRVAEFVADEAGADIFELVPVNPYTDDDLNWRDSDRRVNKEHDNPELQDIELTTIDIPDWDSYDTVFIGYPIWWQEAAWPINNFVKGNDFTDKKVIPFCTSTSSGFGESGSKLAKIAGTGTWIDGMRFSENVAESDVREWVRSLDLE